MSNEINMFICLFFLKFAFVSRPKGFNSILVLKSQIRNNSNKDLNTKSNQN